MNAFASGGSKAIDQTLRGVLAAIAVFADTLEHVRDADLWLFVAYADTIHYAAS